ncbi:MAG: glycosyltransferase [Sedimentisphaerales bacterium]|nr:glycosyltransferase [Sedimentisphaerales bacterium]
MLTAYYIIGSVFAVVQFLCVALIFSNSRYALSKYRRVRSWYQPKTVLIIPCKGLDLSFEKNIKSFFDQDFDNYLLWFVAESEEDPAYAKLCELKRDFADRSQALDMEILVAGIGKGCSQKIHNLLYCIERVEDDIEIIAFADSDICVRRDWLSHLIYPLRQEKNGVASGYRWFIPKRNNLATLALAAGNAKVAQLLGNNIFNQAWGGSMAVRRKVFEELEMQKVWSSALSDDLSLSVTAKKAGYKVAFVPACLAVSYEDTNWPKAFEFVRRQFIITKVFSPGTWWFAIIAMSGSLISTWGTLAVAVYAVVMNLPHLWFFIAVPLVVISSQLARAGIREYTISQLLKSELVRMKVAIASDILLFWLWSIVLWSLIASTSFSRTITWRGIRYKMLSPTETEIIK